MTAVGSAGSGERLSARTARELQTIVLETSVLDEKNVEKLPVYQTQRLLVIW
jgi:hypothetical protein